ncbi:hypothetical protein ACWIEX_05945 [Bosea sp. NPDC055353]
MQRARIRRQQTANIFIHNDLDSAAHYFAGIIRSKQNDDDRNGIAYDCIACATMIAFSFEAYLNFFGSKKINNWKERQSFPDKLKEVFTTLGLTPDWNSRPYVNMTAMKDLRDTFAHGKPVQFEVDVEEEALVGQLDGIRSDLSAGWEKAAQPEPVLEAYDDLNAIWKEMLAASGLEVFDAMTHGFNSLSLVKMIDPPPAE